MNSNEEHLFESSLEKVNDVIILDATEVEVANSAFEKTERLESDMDGWDYCICAISAAASIFISTSAAAESWLAEVHDAASGKSDEYDFIQIALGKLLAHQGDNMDRFAFRGEGEEPPWIQFHRLLYGHDPLAVGEGLEPWNPFLMMYNQQGIAGVFQAARHLIADTFSKQGLPLPGSSFFDSETSDGRPWNHLISLVQELSKEAYGNKGQAAPIYEHFLTLRAQDFAGGMAAKGITAAYFNARGLENAVRIAQVRLVAYTLSFYAEAIVGASKQNGIPYINYPLGVAMGKELAALLVASNKRTLELERKTTQLHERATDLIERHEDLKALLSEGPSDSYCEGGQNER